MVPASRLSRSARLAALLLLAALGGCVSLLLPSQGQRLASFEPFRSDRVGTVPLSDYLTQRCGLVIRSIVSIKPEQGGFVIEESGLGTAVAVARDGYWLTAAHCVTEPHPHVIYTTGERRRIAPARVVWAGDPDDERRDIAIIKIEHRLPLVFSWADLAAVNKGTALVGAGFGGGPDHGSPRVFGGAARSHPVLESARDDDLKTAVVLGDLPFVPGDSGGPLVTREGKLIAVNTRVTLAILGAPTSLSLAPDPGWVEQVIEEDRRREEERSAAW